jgi:hypothetical protein
MGASRSKKLQLETGFDLLYPTISGDGPLAFPILLNAKVGPPEDAWFKGSPAWSAGIFGVGFQPNVTNYDVLHVMLGTTVPRAGGCRWEPAMGSPGTSSGPPTVGKGVVA